MSKLEKTPFASVDIDNPPGGTLTFSSMMATVTGTMGTGTKMLCYQVNSGSINTITCTDNTGPVWKWRQPLSLGGDISLNTYFMLTVYAWDGDGGASKSLPILVAGS
jgi:hypothetical protein